MKVILYILGAFCFYVTRFDPKLKNKQADKIFGFIEDHNKKVSFKSIGELSLLTLNLERINEMQAREQVEAVKTLLDTSHASVLALQEATASQITSLKDAILPHYNIVEEKVSSILDPTSGAVTYLPIIYDSQDFKYINSGIFKTNDKNIKNTYASWVKLMYKPLGKTFTFINLNLYSTKSSIVDIQLANILRDIKTAKEDVNNITVLMGTINSVSDLSRVLMDKALKVLSDPKDPSAKRNTLNSYNDVLGNVQRDFLLSVPSQTHKLQVVYSAILNRFKEGIRFPVHAIVNVVRGK